jgi:hypothetical protein
MFLAVKLLVCLRKGLSCTEPIVSAIRLRFLACSEYQFAILKVKTCGIMTRQGNNRLAMPYFQTVQSKTERGNAEELVRWRVWASPGSSVNLTLPYSAISKGKVELNGTGSDQELGREPHSGGHLDSGSICQY